LRPRSGLDAGDLVFVFFSSHYELHDRDAIFFWLPAFSRGTQTPWDTVFGLQSVPFPTFLSWSLKISVCIPLFFLPPPGSLLLVCGSVFAFFELHWRFTFFPLPLGRLQIGFLLPPLSALARGLWIVLNSRADKTPNLEGVDGDFCRFPLRVSRFASYFRDPMSSRISFPSPTDLKSCFFFFLSSPPAFPLFFPPLLPPSHSLLPLMTSAVPFPPAITLPSSLYCFPPVLILNKHTH